MLDVAIVSLGTTAGLRANDMCLAEMILAAGATCELSAVRLGASRYLQHGMFATDIIQAASARRAARGVQARIVIYSSITAALLQPTLRPYAVRFDSIAAMNRPGRGGIWQRMREKRVLSSARVLIPFGPEAADASAAVVSVRAARATRENTQTDRGRRDAERLPTIITLPPVVSAAEPAPDAPTGTAYAGNPAKRRLELLCSAWRIAAPPQSCLLISGIGERDALDYLARRSTPPPPNVRFGGEIPHDQWISLVAGSVVYLNAAEYEDWGIAQMEALASGTLLVTTPTLGPNPAFRIARRLDPSLVAEDHSVPALARVLRLALSRDGASRARYRERARAELTCYSRDHIRSIVAEDLLPALLSSGY
jgi:glycosyltransferase involved in cell wall biosynthesis